MLCPECLEDIPDNSKICPECGETLEAAQEPPSGSGLEPEDQPVEKIGSKATLPSTAADGGKENQSPHWASHGADRVEHEDSIFKETDDKTTLSPIKKQKKPPAAQSAPRKIKTEPLIIQKDNEINKWVKTDPEPPMEAAIPDHALKKEYAEIPDPPKSAGFNLLILMLTILILITGIAGSYFIKTNVVDSYKKKSSFKRAPQTLSESSSRAEKTPGETDIKESTQSNEIAQNKRHRDNNPLTNSQSNTAVILNTKAFEQQQPADDEALKKEAQERVRQGDEIDRAKQYAADGSLVSPNGENAFEIYETLLSSEFENIQAKARQGIEEIYNKGKAYMAGGQPDNAFKIFSALMDSKHENIRKETIDANFALGQHYADLGRGYGNRGECASAVEMLKRATEILPENTQIQKDIKSIQQRTGVLDIYSDPWGLIIIDGIDIHRISPTNKIKLLCGTHRIALINPDDTVYGKREVEVRIRSGVKSRLVVINEKSTQIDE